jgi:tetratricopeptide (TPR) repeat protein
MSWWSRLTGGKSESEARGRVDYLREALDLERQGDYDAALTSYRLALRDRPNDQRVLQNMAIAFSRTGQAEEAIRCYRRALELDPSLSGAHYGLAFLLIKRGEGADAAHHLERFLERPPVAPDSQRWIAHARHTLAELRGEVPPDGAAGGRGPALPDAPRGYSPSADPSAGL